MINSIGSTIGIMEVNTIASTNALNGITNTEIIKDYRGINILSAYRKLDIQDVNWGILSEIDADEIFAPSIRVRNMYVLLLMIFIVISGVIGSIISKSISKPIKEITEELNVLANTRDLTKRCKVTHNKDEIGQMSRSINNMLDNTAKPTVELSEKANIVASGNLDIAIDIQTIDDVKCS